ncbi:MAG: hypothetical protein ACFFCB_06835 [Candidatus Odinarchaeota archaeon]
MPFNKAIGIVKRKGSKEQQARLALILEESQDTSEIVKFLQDLQLPEGGFPYQRKLGNPYCLSPTSMMMKIMAETKLRTKPVCQRTIGFVKSIQHSQGYWDENPVLASYNPPFWDQPGQLVTQLWLTGAIADTLTRLGEGSSPEVQKASAFLLKYRRKDGRFEGPLLVTWLAIAVLAPTRGFNDPIVQSALAILNQHTDWDATDLSWALECLYWAGVKKDNSVVQHLITTLISLQRPEGHWLSSDNPDDVVSMTLQCLIVLKQFGCI